MHCNMHVHIVFEFLIVYVRSFFYPPLFHTALSRLWRARASSLCFEYLNPSKSQVFFLIILLFILFTRFSAYRNKRTNEIYILCRQFACARDLYRRRKAITEWERKTYLTRMKRGRWGINAFYRTLLSYVWWWNTLHGRTMDRRERRRRRRSDGHPCNVRSVTTYENMCVFFLYPPHFNHLWLFGLSLSLSSYLSRALYSFNTYRSNTLFCGGIAIKIYYILYVINCPMRL